MNKSTEERAEKLMFWFSFIGGVVSLVLVLASVMCEMYVRWTMNQNFTLLGANELAALIVSAFGLIIAMAYIHRPIKKD